MTEPWMGHPNLVAWFDDLEDAVTTALHFNERQRVELRALKAPRANTWIILAKDTKTRDILRGELLEIKQYHELALARDCNVLTWRDDLISEDVFDSENGLLFVEQEYIEEGSSEDIYRELISDSEDYAASEQTGWFYAASEGEYDNETAAAIQMLNFSGNEQRHKKILGFT